MRHRCWLLLLLEAERARIDAPPDPHFPDHWPAPPSPQLQRWAAKLAPVWTTLSAALTHLPAAHLPTRPRGRGLGGPFALPASTRWGLAVATHCFFLFQQLYALLATDLNAQRRRRKFAGFWRLQRLPLVTLPGPHELILGGGGGGGHTRVQACTRDAMPTPRLLGLLETHVPVSDEALRFAREHARGLNVIAREAPGSGCSALRVKRFGFGFGFGFGFACSALCAFVRVCAFAFSRTSHHRDRAGRGADILNTVTSSPRFTRANSTGSLACPPTPTRSRAPAPRWRLPTANPPSRSPRGRTRASGRCPPPHIIVASLSFA